MFASRLRRAASFLSSSESSQESSDRDTRSVEEVLDAANRALGASEATASIAKAMADDGVRFAWQLEQAEAEDWARYGASGGFKLAIKAEIDNPAPTPVTKQDLPDVLHRFLLIPGKDGAEPKPMGSSSSMMLSLLTLQPSDRHNLVIVVCELMGLISGLMMPIPLSLIGMRSSDARHAGSESGWWTLLPTIDDLQDGFASWIFLLLVNTTWFSLLIAVVVTVTGKDASLQFYAAVMKVLGVVFQLFLFGGFWPLIVSFLWTMFTSQTSPWAMMVAFLLGYAILIYLLSITNAALATHMSEGQRGTLRYFHTPWLFKLLSREAIKPAAIKRAAELRQKMGLEPLPLARVEAQPARRHTARVADAAGA